MSGGRGEGNMSTHRPSGSAHDMVMRCFRHQVPEAYGELPVGEPTGVSLHGPGEGYTPTSATSEEQVGNGAQLDSTPEDAIINEKKKKAMAEAQAALDKKRGFLPTIPLYTGDYS